MNTEPSSLSASLNSRARLTRIWFGHGITGVLLVFGVNLFFGLPGSLLPLELLVNVLASAVFGFPMGYAISRARGGQVRGALIGAGFLVASAALIGLVAAGNVTGAALMRFAFTGAILGAILGWHVEHDNA